MDSLTLCSVRRFIKFQFNYFFIVFITLINCDYLKLGHLEVCEVLLEAGAKVDEKDNDGKGPLMLAAQEGHCRWVLILLINTKMSTEYSAYIFFNYKSFKNFDCYVKLFFYDLKYFNFQVIGTSY